jgi:hypothetical protein
MQNYTSILLMIFGLMCFLGTIVVLSIFGDDLHNYNKYAPLFFGIVGIFFGISFVRIAHELI